MAQVGSGERVLILSDQVSTSLVVGADQETPAIGRIVVFLDSLPTQGIWSKDEFGTVRPLNGGTFTDAAWIPFFPAPAPTPTGDITHPGRAAVGILGTGSILAGIRFEVLGDTSFDGSFFVLEKALPSSDQVLRNQVLSHTVDGGLYTKPVGLPERRIDAPGLIRKSIPDNETVIAPDGGQYLVFGSFVLGTGSSLILEGDADLVIL